jgi:hypothetical protein
MKHTQLGHTDWRYVGVWDVDASHMGAFERTRRRRKLDTLRTPYDLFRRDAERAIFPHCILHGINFEHMKREAVALGGPSPESV